MVLHPFEVVYQEQLLVAFERLADAHVKYVIERVVDRACGRGTDQAFRSAGRNVPGYRVAVRTSQRMFSKNSMDFDRLPMGDYELELADADGAQVSRRFAVTVPNALSINAA